LEQISLSSGSASYLLDNPSGVGSVVNSSGAAIGSATYSAYGKQTVTYGTMSTPFGFQGGYTDGSGLVYFINRYYDPATGQFLSVDPDLAETGQPYAFTGDDPLNATDPLGLRWFWVATPGHAATWHWYTGTTYDYLCPGNTTSSHCGGPPASIEPTKSAPKPSPAPVKMVTVTANASEPNAPVARVPQSSIATKSYGPALPSPITPDPFAVLRCFDAAFETLGAYGVSTVVTAGSVLGEGATLGTSTVGVLSGIGMYAGSTALGYVAYQECQEAIDG
jgi:RHS repeat-associated protein